MSRPRTDLEALRQDLHEVYNGNPWHGSSITKVLDGIDADVASRHPIPRAHSIWELVLHMTAWTREVASRVRGAVAKSPPEDWPAPRFGGREQAWEAAKDDFAASQREIEAAVAALTADDLIRWIDNHEGTGYTVGAVIRGLLQHHTYHEGQIALLKRASEPARSALPS
ncbi:MAG TPA: DinB family protein [Gemmatimonadaceae bacterium]|nr:DinB family protein [Gemmatimonadaceae bacterium]